MDFTAKYVNPNDVGRWEGPEARLMLAVIRQAQEDVVRCTYRHEKTALAFFHSEWYAMLAECLGMRPGVYPLGVEEKMKANGRRMNREVHNAI